MGWADPRPEATAWYWNSAYDAPRERVLDALQPFWPFTSLLEVGSHCGPLRRRLRERFGPDFDYYGLDVNAVAVEAGERLARADGDTRATFWKMDVCDLAGLLPAEYDIVLSASCLTCVDPYQFQDALWSLKPLARKAVVVQEDYGTGEWVDGRGWAHAYPAWVVRC